MDFKPYTFGPETYLEGSYEYIDLINIILKGIVSQEEMSEEDRRIINHLNECLFQLNLKRERLENEKKKSKDKRNK